jgi:hypothetical protein
MGLAGRYRRSPVSPGRLGRLGPAARASPVDGVVLAARSPVGRAGHPRQGHGRLTALLCRHRAGYAGDGGGRLRFHFHGQLPASPAIGGLLREIDRPITVVWG